MKSKRTGLCMRELREVLLHYGQYIDESDEELKIVDFLKDYEELIKKSERRRHKDERIE
jgi:hypothetical protein